MDLNSFWKSYGWIFKNLILAVIFVFGLILIASTSLRFCTQHGKEVQVPDFTEMNIEEAMLAAKEAGVRVKVTDSVYVPRMRRGAVTHQYPAALSRVKNGRVVELTTNSRVPGRVEMPSLVGLSTQQAISELKSRGLELESLKYEYDIATNNIKGQMYKARSIAPGTKLRVGSRITLVVGSNPADNKTYIPDLVGRKYMRAVSMIHDRYLNVGQLKFDRSVRSYSDSVSAVVYKQVPEAGKQPYTMGSSVTLYLSVDPEKINN